jgi:hypothetical protein
LTALFRAEFKKGLIKMNVNRKILSDELSSSSAKSTASSSPTLSINKNDSLLNKIDFSFDEATPFSKAINTNSSIYSNLNMWSYDNAESIKNEKENSVYKIVEIKRASSFSNKILEQPSLSLVKYSNESRKVIKKTFSDSPCLPLKEKEKELNISEKLNNLIDENANIHFFASSCINADLPLLFENKCQQVKCVRGGTQK